MNEIKNIHLGRQAFTIAIDAHKALQEYLHAIEKEVGKHSDVLKEVELRMAELLGERGISSEDKVVLPEDVAFLEEQLGAPHDFREDDEEGRGRRGATTDDDQAQKHLYRDPEHGMIAGVAAGLAAYFKIDPLIVRLLFVVLTLSGGAGILFYILLWILVPEARTSSERLQMRGKAVTVESLKETVGRTVERADIPGATKRATAAGQQIFGFIGGVLRYALGALLTTMALALFAWTIIVGTYVLIHGVTLGNEVIFPIGTEAVLGVVSAMVTLGVLALILLAAGMATFRRKWTIPGWVVAVMFGVFFIAASVGTAIGFDIAPQIRDKYRQSQHVETYKVEPFSKVDLVGGETLFHYEPSDKYLVEFRYFGSGELLKDITKHVQNGTLTLATTAYDFDGAGCLLCIDPGGALEVTIYAPSLTDIKLIGDEETSLTSYESFGHPTLNLTVNNSVAVSLKDVHIQKMALDASQNDGTSEGLMKFALSGMQGTLGGQPFGTSYGTVNIYRVGELDIVTGPRVCDRHQNFVQIEPYLVPLPVTTLNGKVIASAEELGRLQTQNKSAYNCVSIEE